MKFLKKLLEIVLIILLTVAACGAVGALGAYFGSSLDAGYLVAIITGAVITLFIIVFVVVMEIKAGAFLKGLNKLSENVQKAREMIEKNQSAVQKSYLEAEEKVVKCYKSYIATNLCLLIADLVAIFCWSYSLSGDGNDWTIIPLVVSIMIAFAVILDVWNTPWLSYDWSSYVKAADYPVLYALANSAKDEVGAKGEVRIIFTMGFDAGVARLGSKISLTLGVALLEILSEEELKQVLIHEFAHIRNESKQMDRITDYASKEEGFSPALLLRRKFDLEYATFKLFASVENERQADETIKTVGSPEKMVSALLKCQAWSFFEREADIHLEHFYASETKRKDAERYMIDSFRAVLPDRKALWLELIRKEIRARNASHPTVSERAAALGVTDYDFTEAEKCEALKKETAKAVKRVDEQLVKESSKHYAAGRESSYLRPTQFIERWNESRDLSDPVAVRTAIIYLNQLGRFDEMEALCDEVLAQPDSQSRTDALMYKGYNRLRFYDVSGIDLIYAAMDDNFNYVEWGLELIGAFCCTMGLEKELNEYRERSISLYQGVVNKEVEVRNATAFSPEPDSAENQKVVDDIVRIAGDVIEKVYLARMDSVSGKAVTVVLLCLDKKAKYDKVGKAYDDVFDYLDTQKDREFQLLFHSQNFKSPYAKKVIKTPDSLRYSKEKQPT